MRRALNLPNPVPPFPAIAVALSAVLLAACSQGDGSQTPKEEKAGPQATADAPAVAEVGVPRAPDETHKGMAAPSLQLEKSADGASDTIADILAENPGKPVLVNLWATWCAPCLRELPSLDRLSASGAIRVVALSQDMEGWSKVDPWLKDNPVPNLDVRLESKMQFGREIEAKALPVTILYGADGKEIWRYTGDRIWDSPESRDLMPAA